MDDVLRDIEIRLERLSARLDLTDQGVRGEIQGIRADLRRLEHDAEEAVQRLEERDREHVPLVRYLPVEKIVFGVVALILTSFVGALIALVVR